MERMSGKQSSSREEQRQTVTEWRIVTGSDPGQQHTVQGGLPAVKGQQLIQEDIERNSDKYVGGKTQTEPNVSGYQKEKCNDLTAH